MLLDAETKQSPGTTPLIDAELKGLCKAPCICPLIPGVDWEQQIPWYTTNCQLFLVEIPNASFCITSPKESKLHPSKTVWVCQCQKPQRINDLNKKISAFGILISGNMLRFQSVVSSLSSLCICTFHYRNFPCYVILITAFKWFHMESSRLLQGFDTYRCLFPNPDPTFILPKIKCLWQSNSIKGTFGRNNK